MTKPTVSDLLPPACVLRVGITGHRSNQLPDDVAALRAVLTKAMSTLADNTRTLLDEDGSGLYREVAQGPKLRLTGSLAPGADRLAMRAAREMGWDTQVVLPRAHDAFLAEQRGACSARDEDSDDAFATLLNSAAAVLTLDGDGEGHRRNAHELAARVIAEQSDVLIAVWDGEPAAGMGGTAHLVREALAHDLAVIHLDPIGSQPSRLLLPGTPDPVTWAEFRVWLGHALLLTPDSHSNSHSAATPTARQRWKMALNESMTISHCPPLYQWLLCLAGKSPPTRTLSYEQSEEHWRENWSSYRVALTQDGQASQLQRDQAFDRLRWRFHLFDHWAECHGRIYRASYLAIYLLAFLATLSGLIGVFQALAGKTFWVFLEVVCISGVIALVVQGRKRHWHERWLDYRAIAEQLRHARLGLWTGQSFEPAPLATEGAAAAWTGWYIRACVRELPMPSATVDSDYCRRALAAIQEHEVAYQRNFNQATERVQESLHHRFEHWEEFVLTLLVVFAAGFLLFSGTTLSGMIDPGDDWEKLIKAAMSFVGIFVPALGAVLLGVRAQGDFLAYSERAKETAGHLDAVDKRIAHWLDDATDDPRFEDLLDAADASIAALSTDVFAWRSVYRRKALSVAA